MRRNSHEILKLHESHCCSARTRIRSYPHTHSRFHPISMFRDYVRIGCPPPNYHLKVGQGIPAAELLVPPAQACPLKLSLLVLCCLHTQFMCPPLATVLWTTPSTPAPTHYVPLESGLPLVAPLVMIAFQAGTTKVCPSACVILVGIECCPRRLWRLELHYGSTRLLCSHIRGFFTNGMQKRYL
jgi:hypothetical protein